MYKSVFFFFSFLNQYSVLDTHSKETDFVNMVYLFLIRQNNKKFNKLVYFKTKGIKFELLCVLLQKI